ncbi:MAG: hypothetical protein VW270_10315 [Candidatus Poseidoniales archaeon]
MAKDVHIDPWSSSQSTDYQRIIDQFGLQEFEHGSVDNPTHLHRRGIVFAHRDFNNIAEAQRHAQSHSVLTGLMPSGQMHKTNTQEKSPDDKSIMDIRSL